MVLSKHRDNFTITFTLPVSYLAVLSGRDEKCVQNFHQKSWIKETIWKT